MNLVTLQRAAEILELSVVSLHGRGVSRSKYTRFKHIVPGSNVIMFDIDGFRAAEDLNIEMVAKVGLMVEYLNGEEGFGYTEISKISGVNLQTISALSFGYKVAYKLLRAMALQRPFHFKRFHEYYGYRLPTRKTVKVLG